MKISDTRAFVNQLLIGLLVTIGFGGTIGVGTVWMRHQVSVVADTNAALERQLVEAERRISDLNALIGEEMNLDVLRRKNQTMGLGLVEMTMAQVNHAVGDPVQLLVARASQRARERENDAAGFRIQLNEPVTAPTAAAATAESAGGAPARLTLGFGSKVGAPAALRLALGNQP